jgi:hypothetical protein
MEIGKYSRLGDGWRIASQPPVLRVERLLAYTGPDDGSEVHRHADRAHSVVDIWRGERPSALGPLAMASRAGTYLRKAGAWW